MFAIPTCSRESRRRWTTASSRLLSSLSLHPDPPRGLSLMSEGAHLPSRARERRRKRAAAGWSGPARPKHDLALHAPRLRSPFPAVTVALVVSLDHRQSRTTVRATATSVQTAGRHVRRPRPPDAKIRQNTKSQTSSGGRANAPDTSPSTPRGPRNSPPCAAPPAAFGSGHAFRAGMKTQ